MPDEPMNRALLAVFGVALFGAGLVGLACSSSSASSPPAQCNTNPFACAKGTTCWPTSCTCPSGQTCSLQTCVPQFACLASVVAQVPGDACFNSLNIATCGDLQACIQNAADGGACMQYCNPQSPTCPGGQTCVVYPVGSIPAAPTINVCASGPLPPPAPPPPPPPPGSDSGIPFDAGADVRPQ